MSVSMESSSWSSSSFSACKEATVMHGRRSESLDELDDIGVMKENLQENERKIYLRKGRHLRFTKPVLIRRLDADAVVIA